MLRQSAAKCLFQRDKGSTTRFYNRRLYNRNTCRCYKWKIGKRF
nr:MAG TPA: hypothetical protein [Caudoviricetes sp.]